MKKKNLTEAPTFIIKIISIVIIISSLFTISASAIKEHLVTLLLIPDKGIEYTDSDSAYLKIINTDTGKVYNYTLYPYNNFSNKVMLAEGTYIILEAGINGRNDIIFETNTDEVVVNASVAIIAKFGDSKILKTETTTTTTTKKTSTTTTTNTTIPTLIDPNVSSTKTSDKTDITDIGGIISSTDNTDNTNNPSSTLIDRSQPSTELTTNPNNEHIKHELGKTAIVIIAVPALILVFGLIVLIISKKKNKENA